MYARRLFNFTSPIISSEGILFNPNVPSEMMFDFFHLYTANEHGPAWCSGVQISGKTERRCDSYRLGFDSNSNTKEAWSGWQVCGVLW